MVAGTWVAGCVGAAFYMIDAAGVVQRAGPAHWLAAVEENTRRGVATEDVRTAECPLQLAPRQHCGGVLPCDSLDRVLSLPEQGNDAPPLSD